MWLFASLLDLAVCVCSGFATPLHVFGPPGTARLVCASVRSGHIPAEGYPAPPPMHVNVTEWALGSGPSPAATRVERPGAEFEITQRNPDQAAGAAPLGVKEIRNFAFCRQPGTSGRREDTKFLLYNGLSWTVQLPNGWTLATAQLRHRVPCWGYVFLVRTCRLPCAPPSALHPQAPAGRSLDAALRQRSVSAPGVARISGVQMTPMQHLHACMHATNAHALNDCGLSLH